MVIDGVKITTNLPDLTREEAQHYVNYARAHLKDALTDLDISESEDGGVDLNWTAHGEKFERVRRVTGYLTGDMRFWNDAKQAEERERVKHGVSDYESISEISLRDCSDNSKTR